MKAGQKVVCVDKSHSVGQPWMWPFEDLLDLQTVYVLAEIEESGMGGFCTWPVGFPEAPIHDNDQWWFELERFRLVSEVGHPPVSLEVPEEAGV